MGLLILEVIELWDLDVKNSLDTLGFEAQNQTIYQMIADLDADGGGNLNFEEFLHLMTTKVS
jgi:Ca2+-binding EF-hand superfamily protein